MFEAAKSFERRGAGLVLTPNATKALARFDLLDKLQRTQRCA